MANELLSLSMLFQNRMFRIPDYQRGYAWQQSQLADFWDDLINLKDNHFHYTGLLSIKPLRSQEASSWGEDLWMIEKGFSPCHIVDGQQRLTSFVILLNELLKFIKNLPENSEKTDEQIVLGYETIKDIRSKYICQKRPPNNLIVTYLFGYETDNPSDEYMRYCILGEGYEGTVSETYYTRNLQFAKGFFSQNIAHVYKEDGISGINNLYYKLTQCLMFNLHEISDDYDVFVAFETMNNRGKKLTNLELLKNRLIYLTTLYDDKEFDEIEKNALRTRINDAWKEIYYQLGRNKAHPLSDDEFLRAHWIIYFTYSRKKGDDYINFLLRKFSPKNIFEKKNNALEDETALIEDSSYESEEDMIEEDEPEVVEVSRLEPSEISNYVASLNHMAKYWYYTYFPDDSTEISDADKYWVRRLNRIGMIYLRPLVATLLSLADNNDKRVEVFDAMERFIFICFRMGGFQSSYGSSLYSRATHALYIRKLDISDFSELFFNDTNNSADDAVKGFIKKIQSNMNKEKGFYAWGALHYFFYEYEEYLAEKNNIDRLKQSWDLFTKAEKDKVSIEHIFPQTPTKTYWRNLYRQFTEDEKITLAGALGNLLPLSQRVNSSLQNDSFPEKKEPKNGRRGYSNGSNSELLVAKNDDWTAEDIYNRSNELIQFLQDTWNIKLEDDEIQSLIGLAFVHDGRSIPPELTEDELIDQGDAAVEVSKKQHFWTNFIRHCRSRNRLEICRRPAPDGSYYYISSGVRDYVFLITIPYGKHLNIGIHTYTGDAYERLYTKKTVIEANFGDKLNWKVSKEGSRERKIFWSEDLDVFAEEGEELFSEMINKYDSLRKALLSAGEDL